MLIPAGNNHRMTDWAQDLLSHEDFTKMVVISWKKLTNVLRMETNFS